MTENSSNTAQTPSPIIFHISNANFYFNSERDAIQFFGGKAPLQKNKVTEFHVVNGEIDQNDLRKIISESKDNLDDNSTEEDISQPSYTVISSDQMVVDDSFKAKKHKRGRPRKYPISDKIISSGPISEKEENADFVKKRGRPLGWKKQSLYRPPSNSRSGLRSISVEREAVNSLLRLTNENLESTMLEGGNANNNSSSPDEEISAEAKNFDRLENFFFGSQNESVESLKG